MSLLIFFFFLSLLLNFILLVSRLVLRCLTLILISSFLSLALTIFRLFQSWLPIKVRNLNIIHVCFFIYDHVFAATSEFQCSFLPTRSCRKLIWRILFWLKIKCCLLHWAWSNTKFTYVFLISTIFSLPFWRLLLCKTIT